MKILIAAVAALFVISCNSKTNFGSTKQVALQKAEEEQRPATVLDNVADMSANSDTTYSPQEPQKPKTPQKNGQQPNADWDKKIMKTASLNAEVKNYDSFYVSLRETVRSI